MLNILVDDTLQIEHTNANKKNTYQHMYIGLNTMIALSFILVQTHRSFQSQYTGLKAFTQPLIT